MPFPPNLYIVGAQKAGTTSLADMLAHHPDICVGKIKEPDFLTRQHAKGNEWLRGNYARPEARWVLDASTSYSAAFPDPHTGRPFDVAGRMKALGPATRIIYLLRDPVRRTWSSYWHHVRAGTEKNSFRTAVVPDSVYVRMSRYADHLRYFYSHFSTDQILVLDFSELSQNPRTTLEKVCNFLDISPPPALPSSDGGQKNAGFQYNAAGRLLRSLFADQNRLKAFIGFVKAILPRQLHSVAASLITRDVPELTAADRSYLAELLEPFTAELEREYGLVHPAWIRAPGGGASTPNQHLYPDDVVRES